MMTATSCVQLKMLLFEERDHQLIITATFFDSNLVRLSASVLI
jgi:hypothetical protein